ncbi:MAG: hypothetical protein U0736_01615 [Gemmataceae bacterium]
MPSATSEATALGSAYLAGLSAGVWPDTDALRRLAGDTTRFLPRWSEETRSHRLSGWRLAVQAVIAYYRG